VLVLVVVIVVFVAYYCYFCCSGGGSCGGCGVGGVGSGGRIAVTVVPAATVQENFRSCYTLIFCDIILCYEIVLLYCS
jgi:hypothetical protein